MNQNLSPATFATVQELVAAARARLAPDLWDYLVGGAESETTVARNRAALDSLAFRPRVLRDVRNVDCSASLLGSPLRVPVFTAPIGSLSLMTPRGPEVSARAATDFGCTAFVSTVADVGLREVAAAASQPLVFQLYLYGDRTWLDKLLANVVDAGYYALCITCDVAAYGRRERDLINRFSPRTATARPNVGDIDRLTMQEFQASLDWREVARIGRETGLPLIIKGVLTAEDARLALEYGAAAIYISNHGGRQLDHARGTMSALPEVVQAVGGGAEIYIDGGFVRGTDVVKAIALGANAVGIGKLQGWALAAGGEAGMRRALELLELEIETTLKLLGARHLGELTPAMLTPEPLVTSPSVISAFPWLTDPARDNPAAQ